MSAFLRRPAIAAIAAIAALSLSLPLAAAGTDERALPNVEASTDASDAQAAPRFRDAAAHEAMRDAPSRSSRASVEPAAAPGQVQQVRAAEINSTSALISWEEPVADPAVTGYQLQLLLGDDVIDEAAWDRETTAWIEALDPDTEYGVRIAAVSDAGAGEPSVLYTFTTTHNSVQRIFGADRYETAVRVSQDAFPFAEVSAAFVAGGRDFPDALAAAAVAGSLGGPVLLTLPNSISTSALDELHALQPEYVFGAGGTSAISSGVFAQAASAATIDAHQFMGANRYDTAAQMTGFWDTVDTVYLASGTNYPDALAGAAAAGSARAPILLTRHSALPGETAAALRALRPARIVALGGPGAISDSVLRRARLSTGVSTNTARWSGASRYETAVSVSQNTFTETRVPVVYVASGRNFADALAGAAAGGALGGPVLLTLPGSISPATLDEIDRLDPVRVVVLGGPSVVSDSILDRIDAVFTG